MRSRCQPIWVILAVFSSALHLGATRRGPTDRRQQGILGSLHKSCRILWLRGEHQEKLWVARNWAATAAIIVATTDAVRTATQRRGALLEGHNDHAFAETAGVALDEAAQRGHVENLNLGHIRVAEAAARDWPGLARGAVGIAVKVVDVDCRKWDGDRSAHRACGPRDCCSQGNAGKVRIALIPL